MIDNDAARLAEILAPANFVILRLDGTYVSPHGPVTDLDQAWGFSTFDEALTSREDDGNLVISMTEAYRRLHKKKHPYGEPGKLLTDSKRAAANRFKGSFPMSAYMYVGGMSIANAYKFDHGTVPGCEYLQEYWDLRLLIAQQAETERKIMIAAGTYTGENR